MKKITLCFVLSIMTLLYSCNKDIEVDKGYQVNVTVDPSDVIGKFIPVEYDDFDIKEGDVLRINLYVYDEEGKLVEELHGKCSDYSQQFEFSVRLQEFGNYTFVATSDVYNYDINYENWSYSEIGDINKFKIEQNWFEGMDCVLGLKIINEKIVEPKNIQINLTSATALLVNIMRDIHYDNEIFDSVYKYERYCISTDPDNIFYTKVGINYYNEFSWLPASSGYYYHLEQLYPQDNVDNNNVYNYSNVLPVKTNLLITCDVTDLVTGEVDFKPYPYIESISATFKSGEQYDLIVDFRERLFNITKTNEYNKSLIDLVENSDNVNKYEVKLMDLINNNPTLKLNNLSK